VKSPALMLVVLSCCLSAAVPAAARDMRFTEEGNTALVFQMPDDWTSRIDEDKNMILGAGDRSAGVSRSIVSVPATVSLDDIASEAMKVAKAQPPQKTRTTSISGHDGYSYDSTTVNDSGVHVNMKVRMVRIDADHIASATLVTVEGISQTQLASAEAVLESMKLSPPD
jgi:hypothetical protein